MKKQKLLFMFLYAVSLSAAGMLLVSCSKKEKSRGEFENTEKESETLRLQDLTRLEIITDRAQFSETAQDQSYNPETDMDWGGSSTDDITASSENVYFNYMDSLFMIPKNGDTVEILCNTPDCEHSLSGRSSSCQAALAPGANPTGLQYYDKGLYYVVSDKAGIALYKSTLNGNIKHQFVFLDEKKASMGAYRVDNQWVLHRGYVYFWNEGRGIYRMSMTDTSSTELIMAVPQEMDELAVNFPPILKAYGSYVYFTIPNNGEYYFMRYNTESGQLEQFTDLSKNLDNFIVKDNKIYYSVWSEKGIYQYDIAAGENTLFLEKENTVFTFFADTDYIYVPQEIENKETSEEYVQVLADVYTWEKESAGIIPFGRVRFGSGGEIDEPAKIYSYGEKYILGSDDNRLYYQNLPDLVEEENLKFYYINKSEISQGAESPLHEAGTFDINS